LLFHAQVTEGVPTENLSVVVASDVVDVFNVDVFHSVYSFHDWVFLFVSEYIILNKMLQFKYLRC